jgi:hypothetical protein
MIVVRWLMMFLILRDGVAGKDRVVQEARTYAWIYAIFWWLVRIVNFLPAE